MAQKILVTGSEGQIGSALVPALVKKFGSSNIICADIKPKLRAVKTSFHYETCDATDLMSLERLVKKHRISTIYHLAALLSVTAEKDPARAWDINMLGLKNVLELGRRYRLKIFWPSSIAVFGGKIPTEHTPQDAPLFPETIYGVTKVAGELMCRYYQAHFGVDVRSVRYPGIISARELSGGGTTDYAVAMFHAAMKSGAYICYLKKGTRLPMMHMNDAVSATIALMGARMKKDVMWQSYNISGLSFSPEELARSITRHRPLAVSYKPDFRQAIAESWPRSIDDSIARTTWGWKPKFAHIDKMTETLFKELQR